VNQFQDAEGIDDDEVDDDHGANVLEGGVSSPKSDELVGSGDSESDAVSLDEMME
jgi:hypothetical protein